MSYRFVSSPNSSAVFAGAARVTYRSRPAARFAFLTGGATKIGAGLGGLFGLLGPGGKSFSGLLPTLLCSRDVLILHCQKPAVHPPSVHSIVASDNLGLALFEINGYFGGEPEPIFTLISAIEHAVKQIGGITVRTIRTRSDQYAEPDEKRALEELARWAADHWRQTCAERPSHPACLQRK